MAKARVGPQMTCALRPNPRNLAAKLGTSQPAFPTWGRILGWTSTGDTSFEKLRIFFGCRCVSPDLLPRHLDEPSPSIQFAEDIQVAEKEIKMEASCLNIAGRGRNMKEERNSQNVRIDQGKTMGKLKTERQEWVQHWCAPYETRLE